MSGGLGPTKDDLTREALAAALGEPLELDEKAVRHVEAFFRRIGRTMPERNRCQAMCPRGARLLENERGTAPGVRAELDGSVVIVVPGVPFEMKHMFERHVVPLLSAQTGQVILAERVHTFGLGESDVGERLGDLMQRGRNPQVGTTVADGVVSVRVRSTAPTREEAEEALAGTVGLVRERVGRAVFGVGDTTLPEVVVRALARHGLTLVTAESCTGGLVGKMVTDVAGSSAVYRGGWVVYSNTLKQRMLDVPEAMLAEEGAVSEEVARCLAVNALAKGGADYAVAVTGIAGPEGGTEAKPVGTVWIALASRDGACEAARHRFPGSRERVRDRTAKTALDWVRRRLGE